MAEYFKSLSPDVPPGTNGFREGGETYAKEAQVKKSIDRVLAIIHREAAALGGDYSRVFWAANKRFEISKFKFKFPRARTYELIKARSRLYRSHILQVNARWKALAEIYTMHSFAPFSNLNLFVKHNVISEISVDFYKFARILLKFHSNF